MKNKKVLKDAELEKVSGGTEFVELPNPVSVLTEEEARLRQTWRRQRYGLVEDDVR